MRLDQTESGFFLDFQNKVRKSIGENQLNEFSALKSGIDRVKYVSNFLTQSNFTIPSELTREGNKNAEAALKAKEEGNKAFQISDYPKALRCYSQSILLIPWNEKDCEALCILLANRSAALYHVEKHLLALWDIEQLSTLGQYPKNLRYKVADRRARCLLALNQQLAARDAFRQTLGALDDGKLDNARRSKWQRDVQIMMSMMEKGAPGGKLRNAPILPDTPPPSLTGGRNPKFPHASAAVQVEYAGPTEGRVARAASVINPGDTLVVENPYVMALLAERRNTHCWHCLCKLVAPLPCPRCSDVSFCSVACQKTALTGHHAIECRFLPALWESGASITCLLALRVLSQGTLAKFKDLQEKLSCLDGAAKVGSKVYHADDYLSLHQLVSHEDARAPSDLLHRTIMAIFLLQGLRSGGYFGADKAADKAVELTSDEAYIGSLLLHNLQVSQFNAHEVAELVTTELSVLDTGYHPDEKTASTSVFLGGAIYPTLALFNHSCNPGVVRYFVGGSKVVARAIRGLAPGEEVCENYGSIYTREDRAARRSKLREQYWFECNCDACQEDWPLFQDMPDMQQSTFRLKCGQCGAGIKVAITEDSPQVAVACPICAHKTSVLASLAGLADTERKLQIARARVDQGENLAALTTYLDVLKVLEKFLAPPPIRDYVLCQQSARKLMLQLGNTTNLSRKNKN